MIGVLIYGDAFGTSGFSYAAADELRHRRRSDALRLPGRCLRAADLELGRREEAIH